MTPEEAFDVTDLVAEARRLLSASCRCTDCGEEDCGWKAYDNQERLAALVPDLISEVERLRTALDTAIPATLACPTCRLTNDDERSVCCSNVWHLTFEDRIPEPRSCQRP